MDDSSIPAPNVYWCCFDCKHGLQRCFICKEYERSKRLVKCAHVGCGHWFHSKCIDYTPTSAATTNDKEAASSPPLPPPPTTYVCPQHQCQKCHKNEHVATIIPTTTMANSTDDQAAATKLNRCFKCPMAYCEACRPAAVHVLDDRRYFACVKHVSSIAFIHKQNINK